MTYIENHTGTGLPTAVTEALNKEVSKLKQPITGPHSMKHAGKEYTGKLIVGSRDITFQIKTVSAASEQKAPKQAATTKAAPKKAAGKKAAAKK